ncbi:MAG: hypothetical protein A2X13_06385 [Bacteroidetes bacterium GWC2_33_15]|nr:MAG: hypothetical protein A2X10_09955 [Bacteroidetes bacterium GWA2_33_15]OFX51574.1 MAG: hypothetical protein A2X13_06385 [Bacteroidetes bacterium GWC2_33_15]OFX63357.1 MAG: hypothetical protein A2X15_13980 [Bacteroidetes bacterium GWB2_32_14]OFX68044.1 MAG: hypothetical protein A2X14_08490 [Bacteroidetes bacterium GWD2_33_33]HAN17134.1 hypothetical protein [Bacteroidales bacterium]
MKKLFVCLFVLISFLSSAQTKEDIFNKNIPVVFLGADYSLAQFTKAEEFENKSDILRLFVDINNLFKPKSTQELIRKKLRRDEVKLDLSYVNTINALVDWQKVHTDNVDYAISDETIAEMIVKLNVDQNLYKDHIGMVIINENCSKTIKRGKVAVAFFTINELKPVLITHYVIKSDGIGFLYYWMDVNLEAIKNLDDLYKEMKKK